MNGQSLQETFAPNNACFGCGPANEKGLHIRSFPRGNEVIADFQPQQWQEAFTGMFNGESSVLCWTVISIGQQLML